MSDGTSGRAAIRFLTLAGGLMAAAAGAQATTIVVDPYNMNGWAFNNRDGGGNPGANPTGVGQMMTGPATLSFKGEIAL